MSAFDQLRSDLVARRDELARRIEGIDNEMSQMALSRTTEIALHCQVMAILQRLDELDDEVGRLGEAEVEPAPEVPLGRRRDVRGEVREYVLSLRDGETVAEIAAALHIRERGVQLALDYLDRKDIVRPRAGRYSGAPGAHGGRESLGTDADDRPALSSPALLKVSESPSATPSTPLGLSVDATEPEKADYTKLIAILGSGLELTLAQLGSREVPADVVAAALADGVITESKSGKYTVYALAGEDDGDNIERDDPDQDEAQAAE